MSPQPKRYEESHPWLSFSTRPHLNSSPGALWWLLGRITAYIESMAQTPLRPDLAWQLHLIYMVKGAQATTAIEGNTLTEEQVREIIEENARLKPSKEYLAQEVRNVSEGFREIADALAEGRTPPVTPDRIRHLNKLVLDQLEVDDDVVAGEWRAHSVHVGSYLAPPAAEVENLVVRMCDWLNGPELEGAETHKALLRAILAHLYLEWIHPFGDGNGRTGRLLEFQILLAAGLPTAAVHLLSNHYNQTRTQYYRELEKASKSGGDFMPFMLYALQGMLDGLEEQHERIREDLEKLVWRDLVDDRLGSEQTRTDQRRRALACALFEHEAPLALGEILKALPHMAPWYDDKTTKTLTRDLNALRAHRLVRKEGTKWVANGSIVMGMRPDVQRFLRPREYG